MVSISGAVRVDGVRIPVSTTVTIRPTAGVSLLVGSSTDDYAARVAETGPIEVHRFFQPTWSPSALRTKILEAEDRGVVPFWSIKFNGTWQQAASGADDARFRELGNMLAALDFPTYGCFHHEPRGSGVSTPTQLIPWSQANVRAMSIIKPIAGPLHRLGTVDNGFPWGVKAAGSALTDSELAVYYTPALLSAVDFLGGDFYDGATNTNTGERAEVKMRRFREWTARIGQGSKPLAVGEWNAVTAEDIRIAGNELLGHSQWAAACIFNSAENNRTDLPDSLGGSWVLRGERLQAFRDLLAAAR